MPGRQVRRGRPAPAAERGFTLLEMLIALAILSLVLAALAPAFYNAFAGTTVAGHRNTADGLAVQAIQNFRAEPYSSVTVSATCPSSQSTVGNMTYKITQCVTWANDNVTGCSDDFKQTTVTVGWPATNPTSTVTQTSAVYPGGQGLCNSTGTTSTTTTTTVPAGDPSPPTNLAATDPSDTTGPTTIDLTWSAPAASSPAVSYYEVYYNSTGAFGDPSTYTTTPEILGAASSTPYEVSGLTFATTYYFEVVAYAASGTYSAADGPVSATTATPTTTTTAPSCIVSSLAVSPTSAMASGNVLVGAVDSNDNLTTSQSYFALSVNANSVCSNVTVHYTTLTGTGKSSTTQTSSTTVTGSGQLTGQAGNGTTYWPIGNDTFTVYVNGVEYSPVTQVQVNICSEKGSSGKC